MKKSKGHAKQSAWRHTKVDVGIAFSCFDLTLRENGIDGYFVVKDPRLETDEQSEYIVTCEVNH